MADKKKGKQRKLEQEKPTKEEYAVAKFLRFNLPVREGKLHGMEVKCFIGNAAVDKLLESKWSASKNPTDPLFTNRMSCVAYLVRLLQKGLFHRAERERRKKDKDKDKSKKKKKDKEGEKEESAGGEEELRERKGKKDKKGKKEKEADTGAEEDAEKKGDSEKKEKKDEKKKKEKRLKLVMPDEQFFEDGDEVYVWIYDPVNAKNFLIGLLMVLGAIALCMFPLWPEEVRVGVYYLSLASAGFLGFILSLVVVRLILFCCIWVLTFGKHHFWFLPNLTEDVGFFDSFRPLYKHDVCSKSEDSKSGDGTKKKKKEKKEEEKEQRAAVVKKEKSSDKEDSDEFEVIKKEDLDQNGADEEDDDGDDDDGDDDGNGDIENDYDDRELDEDYDEDENNRDDIGDTGDEDEDEESNSEAQNSEPKKTK